MRREIKKRGDSTIITIPPEELKGRDLKIGDFVDVTIIKVESGNTLPKHSTTCFKCNKTFTSDSWEDLNKIYKDHKNVCDRRNKK